MLTFKINKKDGEQVGRQRDPKRDEAFSIYKASGGKVNLNVIAAKLGVSESTVRSWKNRGKWDAPGTEEEVKKNNATPLQKNKRNATREVQRIATQRTEEIPTKVKGKKREKQDIKNESLDERKNLFCLYYIKYWNATKAYQQAYKCGYNVANSHGYKLLLNVVISEEIERLKKEHFSNIKLDTGFIFQKYIDIACTDVTDFLTFGQREVPVMTMFGPMMEGDGDDKKPVTKIVNFVDFKSSDEIDGTLISEVKQGKDGASIKLIDKMKALEFLTKHYDLLPDAHKRKLDEEKLKMDRERLDIEKAKAKKDDDEQGKVIVVTLPEGFDDDDPS